MRLASPGRIAMAGLLAATTAAGLLAGARPMLGIAAACSIVFAAVAIANLTAGLCIFVLIVYLDSLPHIGLISLTKIAGLLIALSWIAVIAIRRGARPTFTGAHPAFSYILVLLVFWSGLSALWAEAPDASAQATLRYGLDALLFPIVYVGVTGRRHVEWILTAFVLGALASATYGYWASPNPSLTLDPTRLAGAAIEPNVLAASLVVALALAVGLTSTLKNAPLLRLAGTAAAMAAIVGIFLTGSRSGLLALVSALVVGVVIASRRRRRVALLGLAVLVSALAYFAFLAPNQTRERLTTIRHEGRLDVWKVGWRMVKAHPVQGVGSGNFRETSVHYLLEPGQTDRADLIVDDPKPAQNIYLASLSELGVLGLALVLVVLAFPLRCLAQAARRFTDGGDLRMATLTWAVLVALSGILVSNFFNAIQYSNELWLLMAMGPALLALSGASNHRAVTVSPG